MKITAYLLSCPEREEMRQQTLANLQTTDWQEAPRIEIDQTVYQRRQERQQQTALRLLQRAVSEGSDCILFMEDDLKFNCYLRHNLERWAPLNQLLKDEHFLGSLYNPNICELERHQEQAFFIANPHCVYGSQAFVLSLATARHIVAHWEEIPGMQDIKISRLAAQLGPIYYHIPSLVQHIGDTSVWGGHYHWAQDFDANWKACLPEWQS